MTNRERYKQAFSTLQSSSQHTWEAEEMALIQKKHRKNIAVAAAIACAVVIGAGGTAYAADLGGIQEKISMWLYGTQTEVNVTENGENGYGGYTFTYMQDGETKSIGGGGVSIDEDGNETWLSADEVAAEMSSFADIDVDEDGKVWIYYYDQQIDITDSFDENGICNLTLTHEDKTVYLEITRDEDGGYSLTQTENPTANSSEKYGAKIGDYSPSENITKSDTGKTATTYIGITDNK